MEAALKLSNEADLCKTVKKKRRSNCLDAMRKLEEIEKEINAYRVKKGRMPTQRASLILAGKFHDLLQHQGGLVSTIIFFIDLYKKNRLMDFFLFSGF